MAVHKIVTRNQAIEQGLKRYFTGRSCKYGHISERYVLSYACTTCQLISGSQWRKNNPEIEKERCRVWYENNPDRYAALVGKSLAKRRHKGCIPEHFNVEETVPFYARARQLTKQTGVPHQVDHIVALVLGGMHAPENLQVITERENKQKGLRERYAKFDLPRA